MINRCIERLQNGINQQIELNNIYGDFCNAVQEQMDAKRRPKTIYIKSVFKS